MTAGILAAITGLSSWLSFMLWSRSWFNKVLQIQHTTDATSFQSQKRQGLYDKYPPEPFIVMNFKILKL